jgi:hypothetical protein
MRACHWHVVGMEERVTNLAIVFVSWDVECITSGDRACLAHFELFRSESGTFEE